MDGLRSLVRWRCLILIAVLILLVWAFYHPGQALSRFLFGQEQVMVVELSGLGCGAILHWDPGDLVIRPGTRVRFVNQNRYWSVPVLITTRDSPRQPGMAESEPLPPGESWSHVFWKPGRYFVTSASEMLYWSGLRGWITVEQ